jgi:exosortase J
MVASWVEGQQIVVLAASAHWSTILPPPALVLFAYGSGVVLIAGGTRLYRAALFPIFLLCFANPVPHMFSSFVDLPLQRLSAEIARAFAMHLGQALTPDRLRLMFTPDFGMFIAPGCDGIRGSVTMGFIALIAAYLYRFRWYASALIVVAAVLMGYVFNLARLCLLILYYLVALHFPSLQNKAENADYVIGAVLFLAGTVLLLAAIQRLRTIKASERSLPSDPDPVGDETSSGLRLRYRRLVAMGVVVLLGCTGLVRAEAAIHSANEAGDGTSVRHFPEQLGGYTLVRSWNETLVTGVIVYAWGEYVRAEGGGVPIAVGISPESGAHDPLICHSVRGDDPVWQGQLTSGATDFGAAFYSDGVTKSVEASTLCGAGSCGDYVPRLTRFGLIYRRPVFSSLFRENQKYQTRVLLRAETIDMEMPSDVAREQLTQDLREFVASAPLGELTRSLNQ